MGVLGAGEPLFGYRAEQELKRGLSVSAAAEQVGVVMESFMVIRKVTVTSASRADI